MTRSRPASLIVASHGIPHAVEDSRWQIRSVITVKLAGLFLVVISNTFCNKSLNFNAHLLLQKTFAPHGFLFNNVYLRVYYHPSRFVGLVAKHSVLVQSTKAQKWQIEKKIRVVLKFGRVVEGNVLNIVHCNQTKKWQIGEKIYKVFKFWSNTL